MRRHIYYRETVHGQELFPANNLTYAEHGDGVPTIVKPVIGIAFTEAMYYLSIVATHEFVKSNIFGDTLVSRYRFDRVAVGLPKLQIKSPGPIDDRMGE